MSFRVGSLLLLVTAFMVVPIQRASAQVLPAAAGAAGGFVAGTIVTMGIVVTQARLGHFIYGLDDVVGFNPEIFPILIGPVAGAALGAISPQALGRVGTGALIGLAAGTAVGAGVGTLLGTTSEGRWAGGIIGGAVGMLAGSVIYGVRHARRDSETPVPIASFSLKVPWGR